MTKIHFAADSHRLDSLRKAIEHLLQAQLDLDLAMSGEVDDALVAAIKKAQKRLRDIEGKLTAAAR